MLAASLSVSWNSIKELSLSFLASFLFTSTDSIDTLTPHFFIVTILLAIFVPTPCKHSLRIITRFVLRIYVKIVELFKTA